MGFQNSPSSLKSRLAGFCQPAYLASLISLGIHVALFGAAPSFSNLDMAALGSGGEADAQRTVPLLELTPEEQSRLPDFSSPAYSLFPGFDSPSNFDLQPVPGANIPIAPPSGSTISPMPSIPSMPNIAVGMNPFTPPSQPTNLPPVVWQTSPIRPNPAATSPARPNPAANGAESTPTASTPNGSTPTESAPMAQAGNGAPQPGAQDLLPLRPDGERSPTVAAGPSAGTSPQQPSRDLSAQLQGLAHNTEGTTAEEATAARQDWLSSVRAGATEPNLNVAEPIEIPVTYEGRICLSPEPVNGLIGAWVRPDGTLGDDPALLKSTGYGLLNEQAIAAISAMEFPPGETPAAYEFKISVDYDSESCIDREQLLQSRGGAE